MAWMGQDDDSKYALTTLRYIGDCKSGSAPLALEASGEAWMTRAKAISYIYKVDA